MTVPRLAASDKQEQRAQKAEILRWLTQAYLFNLFHDAGDDDFQKILPAGTLQPGGRVFV